MIHFFWLTPFSAFLGRKYNAIFCFDFQIVIYHGDVTPAFILIKIKQMNSRISLLRANSNVTIFLYRHHFPILSFHSVVLYSFFFF